MFRKADVAIAVPNTLSARQSGASGRAGQRTNLLAGNLAAKKPPGIWVAMYPQKKEESTTPIVSGVQSNSLCRWRRRPRWRS